MQRGITWSILLYLLSTPLLTTACESMANADKSHFSNKVSNEFFVDKTDEIISQYVTPGWFSGNVVIFKDDKVIYDKSFGLADIEKQIKNTSSTKIRIGSINKHYTAALVMQKVQSGEISLDDKLEKFDLGFPVEVAKKITVRHLLRHTSGFADIFTDEYFNTYQSLKNITDKLPLLIDKPLVSEPGKTFNYSNYGYIVLGAILEKIEQKSFQSIINDNILKVIGAENTKYALTEAIEGKAKSYHFSPLGEKIDRTERLENVTPDGGMYSTPYDLALFYSKLFYSNSLVNDSSKSMMSDNYTKSHKLWPEFLADEKTRWSSYGGGPGVSAAVEVLVKDKLIVIALANTDGLVAERISQRVIDVYQGKSYKKIQLPLTLFAKTLLAENGSQYFEQHFKQAATEAGYKEFSARPLNKLGFALINNHQFKQGVSVFIVNTKLFPKEPNTFDSLAYAYEKIGNNELALLNYQKALFLDATFKSAKQGVLRLTQ